MSVRRVLFASSEVFPLIKTGGLADVAGSLPQALCDMRFDVRIILPAYRAVMQRMDKTRCMARLQLPQGEVRILMGDLPDSNVKVWLVDYPPFFDREGNPYLGPDNQPWHDNADRFALFCRVIVEIAMQRTALRWQPDIVHCNDWQTGLVPALLSLEDNAPPTVFTVHNLAYQGLFPYATFVALDLPPALWSVDGLEFYDQMSFMKGGLTFADYITTVSQTYAEEIRTPEFGSGLDGLLRNREQHLVGILNGVDVDAWNPETDRHIAANYSVRDLAPKTINKQALQAAFDLPEQSEVLLIGMVGRLVHQKGIDIVIQAVHALMKLPLQLVLLGSGDDSYESALQSLQQLYPDKLSVRIGYDENLAHLIEAGADTFLMPSRFEPCGLNQLYSLRYGTLPIVRRVGGLADTVIDTDDKNLDKEKATGFVFDGDEPEPLVAVVSRAVQLYQDKLAWKKVQLTAMLQDFSWYQSAQDYIRLYRRLQASGG